MVKSLNAGDILYTIMNNKIMTVIIKNVYVSDFIAKFYYNDNYIMEVLISNDDKEDYFDNYKECYNLFVVNKLVN
jgi:hypothetical protein